MMNNITGYDPLSAFTSTYGVLTDFIGLTLILAFIFGLFNAARQILSSSSEVDSGVDRVDDGEKGLRSSVRKSGWWNK